MTPETFAEELVARLAEVIPAGFHAYANGNLVAVSESGPPFGGVSVDLIAADQARYDIDLFVLVATNVLSGVQDYVSVGLRTPWPQGVGYHPSEMAPPYAKRDGDVLFMGYGDDDEMVIALRPLHLQ